MNEEWRRAYLSEVGREIDNASSQLHETTNWSIGVVVAAVSAVALATDDYPTRWTLAVVVVALVLTARFFVRSCIAYSYLSRWNKIHRAIIQLELPGEADARQKREAELYRAIDAYHIQWKSSNALRRLLWSNLKLGYLQLFAITIALGVYGFARASWCDWSTWLLLAIVIVAAIYEVSVFPSKTYLEHKTTKDSREERNA